MRTIEEEPARSHVHAHVTGDEFDTDAPPFEDRDLSSAPSSAAEDGCVLRSAGYDRRIRWQEGGRLERLFEQRCDQLRERGNGDALAVDGPGARLSYAELDARANQLSRYLRRREGVGPGDRIGVLFDQPVAGYVAMLAVLKLHAVFVPLDPGSPPDRLAYVVSDAGVPIVLCESAQTERFGESDTDATFVCPDQLEGEIAAERHERLGADELPDAPDDLCYVIYTSGSTGRPKGVAVGHPSICNFVRVAAEVYGVAGDDRVYQGLTMAFDFSVEEIWVAWMAGATLVPKPSAGNLVGPELHDFLSAHRVTALCCVPTLLATLDQDLPDLRFLLVSGESCPQDLVDRWYRPGRRFLNVYGPTEATVSATWTRLHPSRPVTIGVPLPTYSAVILDPQNDRALPHGEIGELGIAGIGLAKGYLNRPDLTRRAFIPDFLSIPGNPSGRIYRTGDLARVNDDREIEHQGRIDAQVKIRGYRVELAEIEFVLRQAPGVGQAVVRTYEPEPGVPELVGYYSPRLATEVVDIAAVYACLREMLPAYMVPAYLQQLEELPVLSSGKLDRGSLPPPSGPRQLTVAEDYVAPESDIEQELAEALASVLGIERVSVQSDFFAQLGANSLLMAGFNARLRSRAGALPPVSMKDVYLHPTVRRLAAALSERESGAAPGWDEPEVPEPVGTPHYHLCGALQLLTFVAYASLAAIGLDVGDAWLAAGHGLLDAAGRAVVFGIGVLLCTGLLPIVAKWALIGRFRPRRIRVWSFAYLRFWIVKTLVVSNPVAHLLVGSPLYPLYLRAFGAKIGPRTLILTHHLPVCADLLSVGPDSVIRKKTLLNGYRARAGVIEIGPVTLGGQAFVGEGSVLDIYSTLDDGAQLGHSSSLQAGQVVPAGSCWHGSPAQPAPAGHEYRLLAPANASPARGAIYSAVRLLALVALAGPIEAIVAALLLNHPRLLDSLGASFGATITAAILLGMLLVSLIVATTIPRLLTRALKPGTLYPLYGWRYSLQRVIAVTSNNPLLTGLFGDSCAIPHYLRALGWRLGALEQTGSNFGLEVKQELPGLSHVGTGTMVSDGLSMMNAEFSSRSFRVMPVVIGARNFLGNGISYPAEGRTGDNCLLATKVMVPTYGPRRANVGLLGSPCFEIPRSVQHDRQFDELGSGADRRRRLAAKTRHNVVTMGLHLLVSYLLLLGLVLISLSPLGGTGWREWVGTVASAGLEVAFAVAFLVLAERAVTGFRALQPKFCSIYQVEFWRHERYWKVASNGYMHMFDGTPFKRVVWRLLGVQIGRRVFDDGCAIVERTLVSIGDESTLNMGSCLQSHTLEDGTFKSDLIAVGNRCTVGTGALVNYGVTIRDGAVVDADSFVMKGSRLEVGARWRGNPASEVPS